MEISEMIINVMASVIAVEYMDYGFEKKYSGILRWLLLAGGCMGYFFTLSVLNYFTDFEGLLCIFYGVIPVIYGVIALKGNLFDKVFLGLIWILITLLGTFSVYGVRGLLTGDNLENMLKIDGAVFFSTAVAASAVKFLMGRIVLKCYGRKNRPYRKENWAIAGALFLILLTGLGMFRLEMGNLTGQLRYGIMTLLLLGEFGGVLLLESVYRRMGEYQRKEQEAEFHRQQERVQRENIQDIYRIGREINHWRHDINGKLEVVYRLQEKGKVREAGEKLEKLCGELRWYPELPQETGNEGLNAALMKMIPRCREEKIQFHYVVLGKLDRIDSMDMGTLMCNLLSNAAEACLKKETERFIEVGFREENGRVEIRLENSLEGSVLTDNPQLKSRKEDGERHGFGMETIYEVIRKYRGEYSCREEKGSFVQEILLYYESPEKE